MPWQLTTPLKVGDLDPAGDITHVRVKLQRNDPDLGMMFLRIDYGRIVSGEFRIAELHPVGREQSHTILDEKWRTLVTTHTARRDEKTYDALDRGLYEYCEAEGIIGPGSVV